MSAKPSHEAATAGRVLAAVMAAGAATLAIGLPAAAIAARHEAAPAPAVPAATTPASSTLATSAPAASTPATPSRPTPVATGAPATLVLDAQIALDRLAQQITALGRGSFADCYIGQVADVPARRLTVYATSTARGHDLVAAAATARPDLDFSTARVVVGRFPKVDLDRATRQIEADRALIRSAGITSVGAAADGSGVVVFTSTPTRDWPRMAASIGAVAGLPITLHLATPLTVTRASVVGAPVVGATTPGSATTTSG